MNRFIKFFLPLVLLTSCVTPVSFAAFYIPDGAVTTAKIKDSAVTRAKLASGASSKKLVVSASTTHSLDTTVTDVLELSGSSFTVTLPTAVGIKGYSVVLKHLGTSLTASYCIATTSAQTVGGIASGSYCLNTNQETLEIYSDNANWQIARHETATGEISAGTANYSATSAYVFTWTPSASKSIVIGDTYSDGGSITCTVSATSNTTTGTFSCTGTPASTGTLTRLTGSGNTPLAWGSRTTTGQPAYGTVNLVDRVTYARNGKFARICYAIAWDTAGTIGSGYYIWYLPTGLVIDLTYITPYLVVGNPGASGRPTQASLPTDGYGIVIGSAATNKVEAIVYSSKSVRFAGPSTGNFQFFASDYFAMNNANYNAKVCFDAPIDGWQP